MSTKTSDEPWRDLEKYQLYCPICQCVMTATNYADQSIDDPRDYNYIHRGPDHESADFIACRLGIN